MDGVICDFVGQYARLTQTNLSELDNWDIANYVGISPSEFWANIDEYGEAFWSTMDKYPWTDGLIDFLMFTDHLYLCTSPSQSPSCLSGKMKWIQKNLPSELHRKFFITPHKEHLAGPARILIDDSERNVEKFRRAGGKAILFPQNWNSAKITDPRTKITNELMRML